MLRKADDTLGIMHPRSRTSRTLLALATMLLAAALAAACGTDGGNADAPLLATTAAAESDAEPTADDHAGGDTGHEQVDDDPGTGTHGRTDTVDDTALPLGDGLVSSSPEAGSVFSCQSTFGGGGAFAEGPWISGTTWDATRKVSVDGASDLGGTFAATIGTDEVTLAGNGLPDHGVGTFPVAASDDAYSYDRNPNEIDAWDLMVSLDATPTVAAEPSCTSLGPVGVMRNGVVLFNALDGRGEDAVAHEIQDGCDGHPEQSGTYHYHSLSSCIADGDAGHSEQVGWALDGFGLYGPYGEGGVELSSADLDACHGHVHEVEFNGAVREVYHYHATADYPYTIGCFVGTPVSIDGYGSGAAGAPGGMPSAAPGGLGAPGMPPPPPGRP